MLQCIYATELTVGIEKNVRYFQQLHCRMSNEVIEFEKNLIEKRNENNASQSCALQ